jgi:putative phage-type endonuclease
MASEQFHAERASGIGGSDAHHVHSMPPYGCARQLAYQKTGVPMDEPKPMTGPMRRGVRLEEIAAEYYEEVTERDVSKVNAVRRHKEHPELLVHLDRRIHAIDSRGPGVLEIKTLGEWAWKKMLEDGMQDYVVMQVQHGMMVTGFRWGSIALYWPDGDKIIPIDQERNEKLIAGHMEACLQFWRIVTKGDLPPRLNMHTDEHERCKSCSWVETCQGPAMAEIVAKHPGTIEDRSLAPLIERYIKIKPLAKQAEAELEKVEAEIKIAMGDRIEVHVPYPGKLKAPRIDFRPATEWDFKKLEEQHPELLQKYMRLEWKAGLLTEERPDLAKDYRRPSTRRALRIYTWEKKEK